MLGTPKQLTSKEVEVLLETVQHFLDYPERRGVAGGDADNLSNCFYAQSAHPERHCAVGRCMRPEMRKSVTDKILTLKQMCFEVLPVQGAELVAWRRAWEENSSEAMNWILQEKYHGCRRSFWQGLQRLHDSLVPWKLGRAKSPKAQAEAAHWLSCWETGMHLLFPSAWEHVKPILLTKLQSHYGFIPQGT